MQKFTLIIILSLFSFMLTAQTANIKLVVSGIKVIENSTIMVAIYNSEDAFFDADQIFRQAEIEVDSVSIVYVFNDMPVGEYAVTMYHDEDNDGEMDRKWYGPPKEGYGFSNNFTSNVRPAKFRDASFKLNGDKTITINVVY